tara:strand:+ start:157 stop:1362 length:1206 start_codon:yes stop_codon:yes gene_type:complete
MRAVSDDNRSRVAKLEAEIERVVAENAHLRRENAELRLRSPPSSATGAADPRGAPPPGRALSGLGGNSVVVSGERALSSLSGNGVQAGARATRRKEAAAANAREGKERVASIRKARSASKQVPGTFRGAPKSRRPPPPGMSTNRRGGGRKRSALPRMPPPTTTGVKSYEELQFDVAMGNFNVNEIASPPGALGSGSTAYASASRLLGSAVDLDAEQQPSTHSESVSPLLSRSPLQSLRTVDLDSSASPWEVHTATTEEGYEYPFYWNSETVRVCSFLCFTLVANMRYLERSLSHTHTLSLSLSASPQDATANMPPVEILLEGWVADWDDDSGAPYYYCAITEESRWEAPLIEGLQHVGLTQEPRDVEVQATMQRRVAEAEAEASALVDEESYDEFAWDEEI